MSALATAGAVGNERVSADASCLKSFKGEL